MTKHVLELYLLQPILVNQTLNELRVEKHPDKTFIGRPEKGFDFLGYHFQKTTEYTHLTLRDRFKRVQHRLAVMAIIAR